MKIQRWMRLWATVVVAALALFLRAGNAQQGAEDELRKVEFWTLAWEGRVQDIYYAGQDDEAVPVRANYRYVSGPYEYRGDRVLALFTQKKDQNGEIIRTTVGSFSFPRNGEKFLLLLAENPSARTIGFRVIGLTYDESLFGFGAYRFLNTTSKRMAVQLGESQILIMPKEDKMLRLEIGNKERFSAKIAAVEDEKNWELIFSSEWTHRSNQRVLIIFYEDDEAGEVKMKALMV